MNQMSVTGAHGAAEELFERHGPRFGPALAGYRGHVHRVIDMVAAQVQLTDHEATLLGVAGFFHDAGIWLDDSFDYLTPSMERAADHLDGRPADDLALVSAMIDEHHRVRPARSDSALVEAFRRADLTDVSFGLIPAPGVRLARYRSLLKTYPSSGFRRGLVAVFISWVVRHPSRPLPMLRW